MTARSKKLQAFAIRHVPTGEWMPCRMYRSAQGGWSHWVPGPEQDGWAGTSGFDKNPRVFFTLRSARNALTAWLMGVHRRDTGMSHDFEGTPDGWDEHHVDTPPVPRVRTDMEIVSMTLTWSK